MENTQIVKVHSQKEIEDIAKNYKLCTIEDMNGKKVTTWNSIKKPIKDHLRDCFKRLELNIYPNGYYNICFAQAVRFQKDHNDKYIYCKGKAPTEGPQYLANNGNNGVNKNDLLSVQSALGYITQIAELTTEKNRLEMELKNAKEEITLLEAELAEYEREDGGLSDKKDSDTMTFLKDQSPAIMGVLDRYFELQDKRLSLDEKRLNMGAKPSQNKDPIKRTIKKFEIGSEEHLNYIRLLYKEEKEEQMNKEIDKLELAVPEKYELICNELNLFEDENDNNPEN